jgi:hypothetical protein
LICQFRTGIAARECWFGLCIVALDIAKGCYHEWWGQLVRIGWAWFKKHIDPSSCIKTVWGNIWRERKNLLAPSQKAIASNKIGVDPKTFQKNHINGRCYWIAKLVKRVCHWPVIYSFKLEKIQLCALAFWRLVSRVFLRLNALTRLRRWPLVEIFPFSQEGGPVESAAHPASYCYSFGLSIIWPWSKTRQRWSSRLAEPGRRYSIYPTSNGTMREFWNPGTGTIENAECILHRVRVQWYIGERFHFYHALPVPNTRHKSTKTRALNRTGDFSNNHGHQSRETLKRRGSRDEGEDIQLPQNGLNIFLSSDVAQWSRQAGNESGFIIFKM